MEEVVNPDIKVPGEINEETPLEDTKIPLLKQDSTDKQDDSLQHVQSTEEKMKKIEDLNQTHDREAKMLSAELENKLMIEKENIREVHADEQQQQAALGTQMVQTEVVHEEQHVEGGINKIQDDQLLGEEQINLEIQPIQNEILDEEQQIKVIDVNMTDNDQLHFELSPHEGPITPPPTPELTEGVSQLELCFYEHTEKAESSEVREQIKESIEIKDEANVVEPIKDKKQKRAGFKIDSNKGSLKDAEYDQSSREEIDGHARDEEEEKLKAECTRYAGVERFAGHFIDKIIDKSINSIVAEKGLYLQEIPHIDGEDISVLSSLRSFVEVYGSVIRWPRIHEFTKEIGVSMIDDYMQTWEYDEEWMYYIDFLLEQSDECSDYYLYEAKWSIPSKPYPIPQATASVYFTIEVSRVKPSFCPVDVTYVFEGSRLVHTAGKIPFQEHWLFSIIDAKLKLYRQINSKCDTQ